MTYLFAVRRLPKTIRRTRSRSFVFASALALLLLHVPFAAGQDNGFESPPDPSDTEMPVPVPSQYVDSSCVVSILNLTTNVNDDASWIIPTVPANFGPVRARATCVRNGVTLFGQSDLFTVASAQVVSLPDITLGQVTPVPQTISVTGSATTLTQPGQTAQLTTIATYSDGSTQNISAGSSGVQYSVTNPAIATISADGVVTAIGSGTAIVRAVLEGAQGIASFQVTLSQDSDGDGIPDDAEIRMGLDPHDPTDALLDPDHDGLTNLQEYQFGTDIHNPDTDGDGLTDGQEVLLYHTNPLVADTDGDGVPDGVEIETATDPNDPTSFNLSKALSSIEVDPSAFLLTVNSLTSQASKQLSVIGHLIDGKTTIDLTSTLKGTNYTSSDLTICNFGPPDGTVFAGNVGACTITVTNSGFTATSSGTISGFSPTPLSFVTIPGFANDVAVNGNFAYVAAGASGLQIVNVTDRTQPAIVASVTLSGNANGVTVVGNMVFVAAGSGGLYSVDVSNPLAPVVKGQVTTSGSALDVTVQGNIAYVADSTDLFLVDVTNPAALFKISSLPLTGLIRGVNVDPTRGLAAIAADTTGIYMVDVSKPATPAMLSQLAPGDAHEVAIKGNYVYVADYHSTSMPYVNSLVSVDISTPTAPAVVSSLTNASLGGDLNDVVISGNLALAADVFFVNGIPITDITDPTNIISRAILNFPQRDDNGTGIAVDPSYVYLTTDHSAIEKFGTTGDGRMYIGQYQVPVDNKGIPPTVAIVSPANGTSAVQGSTLEITVNASDDIAVASVNLIVNGQPVLADTVAPYVFYYPVPTGTTTLTIGATAIDFGDNTASSQTISVTSIPDPGTTVVGRVVDSNHNPLAGFLVQVLGHTGTSAADGTFSLPGVPTFPGSITVAASGIAAGTVHIGTSNTIGPVIGGTTNVGDVVTLARPLIIVDSSNGAVSALDTSQNPPTVIPTTGVFGASPEGVTMAPDVSKAFVSFGGGIRVFDMTQNPPAYVGDISPFGLEAALSSVVTSNGRFLMSLWNQDVVTAIDVTKLTVVSQLPVLIGTELAVTPDATTVIVGDPNDNVFRILALSSLGVLTDTGKTVPYNFLFWGTGIAMAPNGQFALVANPDANTATVVKIDVQHNVTIGSTISMCCSPWGVAITPDGTKAYVTIGQTNTLAVLSIDANNNVADTGTRIAIPNGVPSETHVPGGFNGGISGIAAALDGKIYVVNTASSNGLGTVTIVDSKTDTVVGTVAVPAVPADVGVPQ
jgi:DNA-binding beta-propeller fold protein YncE